MHTLKLFSSLGRDQLMMRCVYVCDRVGEPCGVNRFVQTNPSATDASCSEHDSVSAKERFTQHSIEIAIVRVKKNKPWFHRDRVSAFNLALLVASRATAACQAIDFRLRLGAVRFDTSPARHASPDRKCHRLDRCNNRVG